MEIYLYYAQVEIPAGINEYFKVDDFNNYPLVRPPQKFQDSRGFIINIADGLLGDVAIISSMANTVRANHVHSKDWHLSYLISGQLKYYWAQDQNQKSMLIYPGQLFYTPPGVPHKMYFLENSCFVAVASLSRTQKNYESDTVRLEDSYFK